MMTNIEERITQMASCGLSPYVIEERLGMEHYTIHIKYHKALMNGYVTAPASGRVHTLSAEEKAARKRERAKERREEKKAEAKKQAEAPKRVEMTHEERLARRREYDARYRRKHREEYNRKRRELYHAMSPEKKKALFERLVEYKRATYEQRKDKINERRRELRRLKKEQANAEKQKAAQGVQAPSDSENRLLLSAGND